jgi:hypothetical protein
MFKPFEKQIGTMKIEQRAGRERLALRLDRSPFSFQVVMLVKTTPANDRLLEKLVESSSTHSSTTLRAEWENGSLQDSRMRRLPTICAG